MKSSRLQGYVQGGETADAVESVCLCMDVPPLEVSSWPRHLTPVCICAHLGCHWHFLIIATEQWSGKNGV